MNKISVPILTVLFSFGNVHYNTQLEKVFVKLQYMLVLKGVLFFKTSLRQGP